MPDPVTPAAPASPAVSAAPAVAPVVASPSSAAPAQTPAAAPSDKPNAAAASSAAAPAEAPKADAPKAPERVNALTDAPAEAAKPADTPQGAPEKYDLKIPEGVKIAEDRLARFTEGAKKFNLSNDAAQSLLDQHIAEVRAETQAVYENWNNQQIAWQKEIGADKTIGDGNQGLKPEAKAALGKVIDSLGPELGQAFRQALNFTGAGNNPAVVRGLVKMAARFTEGGPVKGNPVSGAASVAAKLYPSASGKG